MKKTLLDGIGHFVSYTYGNVVFLCISNYTVPNDKYGGGGSVGNYLKPQSPINTLVMLENYGNAILTIDTDGNITLYSVDLSQYLSGRITGNVCYLRI